MNKKHILIILAITGILVLAIVGIWLVNNKGNTELNGGNNSKNEDAYVTSPQIEREKIESGELELEIPEWSTPPEEDPFMETPGSYKADDPTLITVEGDDENTDDSEIWKGEPLEIEEYNNDKQINTINNFKVPKLEGSGIGND